MWQIYAAIGAAAGVHLGTQMSARNQKNAKYAGDVNVADEQRNNLRNNYANSPEIEMLVRQINQNAQNDRMAYLESIIPGFSGTSQQLRDQAQASASGQIEENSLRDITRRGFEKQYTSGIAGQAGGFNLLRDIGRAQYAGQQESMQAMQQLYKLTGIDQTSVEGFYTTNEEALNTAMQNRQYRQAYLNAAQTADNVRKNAKWNMLADASNQYAQMKSGKANAPVQTQYRNYSYAAEDNYSTNYLNQ
jgi:hypothetical protein